VNILSADSASGRSLGSLIGYNPVDVRINENWTSDDSISTCSGENDSNYNLDMPVLKSLDMAKQSRAVITEKNSLIQNLRKELLLLLFRKVNDSVSSLKQDSLYKAEEGIPAKLQDILNPSVSFLEEYTDSDDEQAMVISQVPRQKARLACPFYIYDHKKHCSCLENGDLRSIKDVMEHLWRRHVMPLYCPVCYQTFKRGHERDAHCRTVKCTAARSSITGMTEKQWEKLKLGNNNSIRTGEMEEWVYIWETLFPNTMLTRSPYLVEYHEIRITILKDYWNRWGNSVVSEYLHRTELGSEAGYVDVKDICKLVLEDAVQEILKDD
jgi:hypothetical protein